MHKEDKRRAVASVPAYGLRPILVRIFDRQAEQAEDNKERSDIKNMFMVNKCLSYGHRSSRKDHDPESYLGNALQDIRLFS